MSISYILVLGLQGFCIYHAIKNRKEYYWFFVIMFLPVIGGLVYLFTQVFQKKDIHSVQNELVKVINPTKKVNDLRQQVAFSDTFQNRVNLADALYEIGDYSSGITELETALNGTYNDVATLKKLIEGYSQLDDHEKVVFYAEMIKDRPDFQKSRSQFLYGLSLKEQGQFDLAEKHLRPIDQRYSNYRERFVLAQFLIDRDKKEEAKELLAEIISESEHMSKPNRHQYRQVIYDVKELIKQIDG